MYKLWKHQEKVVQKAMGFDDGVFIAHDMGCGKTFSSIEIIQRKNASRVLIVCPLSVIDTWPDQFKMFERENFKILAIKEKPETKPHHPDIFYTGKKTVKAKKEFIEKFINERELLKQKYAIIINYESFWRSPLGPSYSSKNNRLTDTGYFTKVPWDCVVFDESHRLKTHNSNVSKFAYKVSKISKFNILVTGTPMAKPFDVFSQMRLINDSFFGTSFHKFKNEYAEFGGFENREVIRYKNLDELSRLFYKRADKVTKNQVLELPPVTHKRIEYDLSPKARKIYNDIEREFIAQLETGEIATVNNALTKMLRLSQIATGYLAIDNKETGEIIDDSLDKIIKDTIEDFDKKEPLVFFTVFQNEMKRVKEILEKDGRTVGLLGMGQNDLYKFKAEEIDCLVVQIRAGGAGIDLSRSCYGFYVSKNFDLLSYLQSLARQDRPGQKNKVLFNHFIARNTISEKIMKAIESGENLIETVLSTYSKKNLPLNFSSEIKQAA